MVRFVVRATAFAAVALGAQWLVCCTFENHEDFPAHVLLEEGLAESPGVLLVGDSTLEHRCSADADQRPTVVLLQERLPSLSVLQVSHGAYNPDVYAPLCGSIVRSGHRPKLVVLVLNLRSFSPMWDMRPMYQFAKEKAILAFENTRCRFLLRPLMVFNAFEMEPVSMRQYLELPVFRGDEQVGKVKDFDNYRFHTFSEENLKKRIVLQYMARIESSHRKIRSAADCVRTLREAGIRALFYVTPLDWETCERYYGSEFRGILDDNVETVAARIRACGGAVLDLSRLLPAEAFNWRPQLYPNEHLNEQGRHALARELARWIEEDIRKMPGHYRVDAVSGKLCAYPQVEHGEGSGW